ncbi:MMPL family transporter [Demequina sp. SYSU T00192]|uniref:MMPL family transporter n=1 Tax=Demequina litoralis TaxID=3051660 RepID=A0ABT8G5U6_9MICO|nr:MMPL family transporter [Demequina sp. SYSU T00192]MDN4474508.1 MMPL family transporter [Demequina sp. SYSU T00192]
MGGFARIGRLIARAPRLVVVLAVIGTLGLYALATVGVNGEGLFQRVSTGPPLVEGSDSWEVYEAFERTADESIGPPVASYVRGVDPEDPDVAVAIGEAAAEIAALDGVNAVLSPWGLVEGPEFDQHALPSTGELGSGADPAWDPLGEYLDTLVDQDGTGLLVQTIFGDLEGADPLPIHEEVVGLVEDAVDGLRSEYPDANVLSSSNPLVFDDFTVQLEEDLITGEMIALPAALIVMVFVFGGFLAAATPLTGAIASIAGGLAVLYGFSYLLDLDQSAVNVVTVLGIGLSIDYGLLIVSRFREELHRIGGDPREARAEAIEHTLATAGRTVFFSAVVVAASVGGMLLFPVEMMKGFGGAALGVVTTAMIASLTIVPAVAYLLAPRIAGPSLLSRVPCLRRVLAATSNVDREDGAFARLAGWGQRRPWLVVIAATALLLVLASPVMGLALRNSDIEALPVGNERRDYADAFAEGFPDLADPAIIVHVPDPDASVEVWAWLDPGLDSVDGVADVSHAYTIGDEQFVDVTIDADDPQGPEARDTVLALRALDAPFEFHVGGVAATQIDFVDAIREGALLAAGLVVIVAFVLLFLMTGSLLVPAKTLVINSLSLLASLGVVTWIFGEGHLEGTLGFTSTGGVETYVAVIIVAFGFGLAMDYEVFLLSRIKEYVDAGEDNDAAVRKGLQRSGRIITSAATVIVLVFLGFALGDLLMIKEVGVGLAVAVVLDASVVRLFLVPATMTLLGDWNWWAPGPLRRLHRRLSLQH